MTDGPALGAVDVDAPEIVDDVAVVAAAAAAAGYAPFDAAVVCDADHPPKPWSNCWLPQRAGSWSLACSRNECGMCMM